MSTDLERYRAFLNGAGVWYVVSPRHEYDPSRGLVEVPGVIVSFSDWQSESGTVVAGFDENGALVEMRGWE